MAKAILGLDHIIIGVHDLAAARAEYARLGFTCAPYGDHVERPTGNHCIMFRDTYLELLGVTKPQYPDSSGFLATLSTRGEGLQRVALGTPDADAARADLVAAGFAPDGPRDLARPSDDPPGIVRFRNLFLQADETAGLPLFLCGHKTPELMRTPALETHANGAKSFSGTTVLVEAVEPVAAIMERLFGPGSVASAAWGARVETGRGRIDLATRDGFAARHPGATAPALPMPAYYALEIGVGDVAATAAHMSAAGVPHERIGDMVRVVPDAARGVLLEFVPG